MKDEVRFAKTKHGLCLAALLLPEIYLQMYMFIKFFKSNKSYAKAIFILLTAGIFFITVAHKFPAIF